MGAISLPSRLFDLLERFFDTVGVGEERGNDGIGLVMLYGDCNVNAVVGVRICCMFGFQTESFLIYARSDAAYAEGSLASFFEMTDSRYVYCVPS